MSKPSIATQQRLDQKYRLYTARVERVDFESKLLSIKILDDGTVYENVSVYPAIYSSAEATEVHMPEVGALCLCTNLYSTAGTNFPAIVTWISGDLPLNEAGLAYRDPAKPESHRMRGLYRRVYPGRRSTFLSTGFSEKVAEGWDRSSSDLSREKLDTFTRTKFIVTGSTTSATEAGISTSGQVIRPGAEIKSMILPDGRTSQVITLSGEPILERYEKGTLNTIPLVERIVRTQEFGLDYPLPLEVLGTDVHDEILGLTTPPMSRTNVSRSGQIDVDGQTSAIDQKFDHPQGDTGTRRGLGPLEKEAQSPTRRGYIHEGVVGTLVGYNLFDTSTYGKVLKPTLFPLTQQGRFGTDVTSGYVPVVNSTDQVESFLAASVYSSRFPYEYNTTRLDVTKEGMVQLEIGATIPKENNTLDGGKYEHPHGAGRSLEAHLVGSTKLVLGKNRDEEESLDLTTLGQVVMRLGADDSSLPDTRRDILTQVRELGDTVSKRTTQFWTKPKLKPGDAGNLTNKVGAENVSLRAATDGGVIARIGARSPEAKRRHLMNGYSDGQGKTQWALGDAGRMDARSKGRPTYGAGDSTYAFHDLSKAGSPISGFPPYFYSGPPVGDMNRSGLSLDLHLVRDALLRLGANPETGQSLLLDLGGGMVLALGKDKKGRSITASLDGGAEITINANDAGKALQVEFKGDVNFVVEGNHHLHVTGDYIVDVNGDHITKVNGESIIKAQNVRQAALVQHVTQAVDIVHDQGGQSV